MSNALRNAKYSIHQLIQKQHIYSHKTKADTKEILMRSVKDLHKLGFKLSHIRGLKQKHIKTLVNYWKEKELNPGTIKNYLAKLRFAAQALNKSNLILSNDHYGIEKRQYRSSQNKAVTNIDISKITDPYIRLSVQAQQLFGLRREEALKLNVSQADQGDFLELKGSWTKGGIPRKIPITTQEQRDFLNQVQSFVGKGSLIPASKTNKQQIHTYVSQTREAGFKNLHGLRHAYAQKRYRDLTNQLTNGNGWDCPKQGGPLKSEMTDVQKRIDHKVRLEISANLGHSRTTITKTYCG